MNRSIFSLSAIAVFLVCAALAITACGSSGGGGGGGKGNGNDDGGGDNGGGDGDGDVSVCEGDAVYFAGYDATNGVELWMSDGTSDGTRIAKDINPTGNSIDETQNGVMLDGIFYIVADDGMHGRELWKSEGTEDCTQLVEDIDTGEGSGSSPSALTIVDGVLYFSANNGTDGSEPYYLDGDGLPVQIANLLAGSSGSNPSKFLLRGGHLFFKATDVFGSAAELFEWDGETEPVKQDLAEESEGFGANLSNVVTLGGKIYITAGNASDGDQLYVWDDGYTTIDMNGGVNFTGAMLTVAADRVFFVADDVTSGIELWSSQGTQGTTELVADINPAGDGLDTTALYPLGDRLVFLADDGANGRQLWGTDGTPGEQVMLTAFNTEGSGISLKLPIVVDGVLYFVVDGALWRTDGTVDGTIDVSDATGLAPVDTCTAIIFGKMTDFLLFANDSDADGRAELWRTDGTPEGTNMLSDVEIRGNFDCL